jgi:hypothetical protein
MAEGVDGAPRCIILLYFLSFFCRGGTTSRGHPFYLSRLNSFCAKLLPVVCLFVSGSFLSEHSVDDSVLHLSG